jgi:hypothetical protein
MKSPRGAPVAPLKLEDSGRSAAPPAAAAAAPAAPAAEEKSTDKWLEKYAVHCHSVPLRMRITGADTE